MMKRILIAAVAGGLIVFVWAAVAHMGTPLGTAGLRTLQEEEAVVAALKASGNGSAVLLSGRRHEPAN